MSWVSADDRIAQPEVSSVVPEDRILCTAGRRPAKAWAGIAEANVPARASAAHSAVVRVLDPLMCPSLLHAAGAGCFPAVMPPMLGPGALAGQ
ncbi:hypothetical protein Airi01_097640 [Actinoallomurus iriomotensis]|uniref:Uncharacterized protein n=1 Tax=Actinoallomurus iriomotensis TaxID=478107 RepID=A0A9W6RWP2_9ACTN|nr:hypothetical protein Airi01_097640 [Actinoallomurus iriomotensis]